MISSWCSNLVLAAPLQGHAILNELVPLPSCGEAAALGRRPEAPLELPDEALELGPTPASPSRRMMVSACTIFLLVSLVHREVDEDAESPSPSPWPRDVALGHA
jgi:hypothetical protein